MRKVTDLNPNEAILISNDADLKVLEEFDKAGIVWIDGLIATLYNPLEAAGEPIVIVKAGSKYIQWSFFKGITTSHTIYPATDFIGSEFSGNGLTVSEPDNTISIEPSETIESLRADKAELIEALKQIEQFSDIGDDFIALVRMKRIASQTLAKYETK
jgi:hypothetical protein